MLCCEFRITKFVFVCPVERARIMNAPGHASTGYLVIDGVRHSYVYEGGLWEVLRGGVGVVQNISVTAHQWYSSPPQTLIA
jgi:hypothetical protein